MLRIKTFKLHQLHYQNEYVGLRGVARKGTPHPSIMVYLVDNDPK